MGKKRKELSQEEIWDDSELIQSWNDSYQEYKLYHSIHARGERVKDVLLAAQVEEQQTIGGPPVDKQGSPNSREAKNGDLEDGELEDDEASMPIDLHATHQRQDTPLSQPQQPQRSTQQPVSGQFAPGLPEIPHGLAVASSRDEALKNLMMSWYWAGYYTGLYEGQAMAGNPEGQRDADKG